MKNSILLVLTLVTAGLFAAAHAGQIYKWVDEHGNVHYSQSPQHQSAKEMNIKIPKHSQSSTESSNQSEQNKTESQENGQADGNGQDPEAVAQKQKEARKKNCQIAMKRLATITTGGRLYEVNEKGERQYWDDNTRQAKLADAQKDVDQWCGEE